MKHFLFLLSRCIVIFLISTLAFFVLIVVTARILTPFLVQKTEVVERFASNLLHKPVKIEHFSVRWYGITPVLQGTNITIWNDSKTQCLSKLKQLKLSVNLLKTFLTAHLTVDKIILFNSQLVIYESKAGQLTLNGFNVALKQLKKNRINRINPFLAWLFISQIKLQNISIIYCPLSGEKWPDMKCDAVISQKNNRYYLWAQLHLLGTKQESIIMIANLANMAKLATNKEKNECYLEGHSVLLDRWFLFFKKNYLIQNAIGNFKIWINWQNTHITKIQALVDSIENSVLRFNKQPAITLMPFSANLEWRPTMDNRWVADAMIKNLGFLSWKKIPTVKGLSAYCHILPQSGKMIAHSNNLDIGLTTLFNKPIHLADLYSELDWFYKTNSPISIKVKKFKLANEDASVKGQMSLLIPKNDEINPIMSLLASIKVDRAANISNYLPLPFFGQKLKNWLTMAFIRGKAQGSILLQGPLTKFPFDKKEGAFLIGTKIIDSELHYNPAWPNLQIDKAELNFAGRQMQIDLNKGKIFGVNLTSIHACIPTIKAQVNSNLYISASAIYSSLEKGVAFLQATPLIKKVKALSNLIISGPLKLVLQLTIPLEPKLTSLKVMGQGLTQNATLSIPKHKIQINALQGQFSFNEKELQAKKITGLLWNKPIEISIKSNPNIQLAINYNGINSVLSPVDNDWRFFINNKTIKGSIIIPNNIGGAINANFNYIHFNPTPSTSTDWNIKKIPPINLYADDVRYKALKIGSLALNLQPTLTGISINKLEINNTNYHLMARGNWHIKKNNSTDFKGYLNSNSLSKFLKNLGLSASIAANQAHIIFDLKWPDAPYVFKLSKLQGNFSFYLTNGKIVDVGSNTEVKLAFGKLLNFLSLQSLGRRLQLDFSDLQNKGFDFSSMKGSFNLRGENAFTRDVSIEGSVADITMVGRVGLKIKDYDLVIKVIPHFTSSLPVIIGLAGGPVAGAVTWLANTVLGSSVQKIAETSYHITGSWSKPQIQKKI